MAEAGAEPEENVGVYDQIIQEVGEFGFYQKCRFFVLLTVACYMATSQGGNVVLSATFPVDFNCSFPDLPHNMKNLSHDTLVSYLYADLPSNYKPGCGLRNATQIGRMLTPTGKPIGNFTGVSSYFKNVSTATCYANGKGFMYEKGHKNTLTTDWDLVCDDDAWGANFLTVSLFVGVPGNYLFMIMSDYLGRKLVFFIITLYYIVTSVLCMVSVNRWMFIVMTSLYTCSAGAVFTVAIIWLVELCGPKQRSWINGYFAGVSSFTAVIQIIQAWLLPNWQLLYATTTAPALPVMVLWWWMDESPRWLGGKGRHKEELKVLKTIAKKNGKEFNEEKIRAMIEKAAGKEPEDSKKKTENEKNGHAKESRETKDDAGEKISPLAIFTNRNMLLHFVVTGYLTACCWLVYSGVNLSTGTIDATGDINPYLVFGAITLIQFPAGFILVLSNTFGRVWTTSVYTGIAGICLAGAAVFNGNTIVVVVLVVIASFFINAAVTLSGQFVQELFPTSLRGSAVAYNSLLVGGMNCAVPYILQAAKEIPQLPMGVFAFAGITAAILFLFCPEMMGLNLMETIEETKTGPKFGFRAFWRNIRFEAIRNRNKKNDQIVQMTRDQEEDRVEFENGKF